MLWWLILSQLEQIASSERVDLQCVVEVVLNEAVVHAGDVNDEVKRVLCEDRPE